MVSQAGHPDCPLQVEGAPVQQESLVSSNLCNVRWVWQGSAAQGAPTTAALAGLASEFTAKV